MFRNKKKKSKKEGDNSLSSKNSSSGKASSSSSGQWSRSSGTGFEPSSESQRSSGVSAVLGGVAEFKVKLLAVLDNLEDVDNQGAIGMINTIDLNQQYRRIPFIAKDDSQVILVLFKYGIKVMEVNSPVVLYRHPLYSIQRVVCYDDGLGKQVVAIKVGQPRKTKYGLLAFQCNSQDQATEICRTLATIIEVITTPERS
ncbi:integrin beta-1-binding protein 1-like [Branchiostoma lanceolatum]|uniref:ITGB1BP1 protein n=1 Tax=Branchiostoma lanceolatum TaxID=7740 RepID=A0A8J9ZLJ2_BRALA|nr:ITGB1BP1 [Branchiostoma lanceolatum]